MEGINEGIEYYRRKNVLTESWVYLNLRNEERNKAGEKK